MKVLIIINWAPYENERAYNAIRIAAQFQKDYEGTEVRIYLIEDGVLCAMPREQPQNVSYNVEQMLDAVIQKGGKLKMCTSCGESRGLKETKLTIGTEWSSMKDLTCWIADSDKVINY